MQFTIIPVTNFEQNCTLVSCEKTGKAAAIDPGGDIERILAEVEKQDLILETLDHCLGNRTHAANILGISIRTLRNKIAAYKKDAKTDEDLAKLGLDAD